MLAQIHSFILQGIDPILCEVEVDVSQAGLPKTTIVGLPDAAVRESLERVRTAMTNCGYPVPMSRLTVNLAPADLRKEGPMYDLPIALGLLAAGNIIQTDKHRGLLFAGELALDGRIRPINGTINLALLCRKHNMQGIVVPKDNADEGAAVEGINVYPMNSLRDVVCFLNNHEEFKPLDHLDFQAACNAQPCSVDFADIKGQEAVKRAMTIAAAGNHNILMIGPAGTGKTLSAKALPGILPPLSRDEALQVTRIYSSVGLVPKGQSLITQRPVRSPHHTASSAALIGGGTIPRPGEISLAHHGILFLDEMPEFPCTVLETLRQPLEDHLVTIARSQGTFQFPAKFMLVAAMNPTPGGDKPADQIGHLEMQRYLSKISGPLVDRIDIHVEVPRIPYEQLAASNHTGTSSAQMRQRILHARNIQTKRNGGSLHTNSTLSGKQLDQLAPLDNPSSSLLKNALTELGLSARAYDKIRRIARTIADIEDQPEISLQHVAEAIQYRLMDRQSFAFS
ncbi:YifB family Mg chelatase-like AAA ATPase [Poriferisphaera sp. WC338]|uniref:YifB family Mg chelatase-like AAA ATPase n=1 Tax=Poriferisphaera sp. WC338 TaxID=3425129 RepID=UPI003D818ED6